MRTKIQLDNFNKVLFREKQVHNKAGPGVLKEALREGNSKTFKINRKPVSKAMHVSYYGLSGGIHFVAR